VATVEPIPEPMRNRATSYVNAALERELARLGKAPKHQRNNCLNTCAFKIGQLLPYGILTADECASALSRTATQIGLEDTEIAATIKSGLSAGEECPRRLPFLKSAPEISKAPAIRGELAATLTLELSKLGETDTDNAQRFAKRCADRIIFTPGLGWLAYDGRRWQRDGALQCMELAKATARKISKESQYLSDGPARVSRQKFAQASLSKGALDRMIDLAKPLLLVEDGKLDADPLLLNTRNGTIDLRTGDLEGHDPRDLLTKLAPVVADPKAKCPIFKKFIKRMTNGDEELATYLRACVGYSLTGLTTEQVFFFCYGKSGANGKSTFVNLTRDLMGDYACHTPTDTLLTKKFDNNIPADLARLAGVRMVTAVEANFNQNLDEAKLKSMTGGEPITARFMRHDFFEFFPEFKLWLVANDMPRVRGTDTAFWRRVRVIPFEVQIAGKEVDRKLPRKLREEFPGILAWAVRGCRQWQTEGKLVEPAAVRKASGRWLRAADHVKRFVEENLALEPSNLLGSAKLRRN
jgi:putative DNA primase/helicase